MSDVSSASICETPEIKALCEEFKNLSPKLVAITERINFIKSKLKEESKNKKVILSSGVKISNTERKGNIDYGAIKGIQKMVEDGSIEKYRKKSTTTTKITIVG